MKLIDKYKSFQSKDIYKLISLINDLVINDYWLFNYDECFFIEATRKFSKDTLLHLYIVTAVTNHYHSRFRKDDYDELVNELELFYELFDHYEIRVSEFETDSEDEWREIIIWFEQYLEQFVELFDKMADDAFYILFNDRIFLHKFNNLIIETIKELEFPKEYLTKKWTIKRERIPSWLKKAVFHRDKWRCVFCNTDLTNLINTLESSNYDHIVPLDLFGTNDPCNIQLTCEYCNKFKRNKHSNTSSTYIPWRPRTIKT